MKKQRRISQYLKRATILMAVMVIYLSSLLAFIPIQLVNAAGEEYALYFPDDPGSQRAVSDAWTGKNNYGDAGWSKMSVVANGGFWGDAGTLAFDEKLTNEFAQNQAGHTTGNEPFFSKRYYCTKDDGQNKITFTRPAEDKEYYEVFYAVALDSTDNDGDKFVKKSTKHSAFSGVASVQDFSIKEGNAFNRRKTVYDITQDDKGPSDLDKVHGNENDAKGIYGISDANKKCRPQHAKLSLPNYTGLSASEKEKFKKAAEVAATGGANGSDEETQANCDVKASSPLSWIICPVIDLGANMTDFVFKQIVSPLLRDVPVSTDSKDPSYLTWQQFRLIGNILLVGALLAIVYSQAKGSK